MSGHFRRIASLALMLLMLTVLLCGCWDYREIEEQYMITAVALDATSDPQNICVTVQVANLLNAEISPQGEPVIVLSDISSSLLSSLAKMDENSDRNLLYHHNQIRLFGSELAAQGINAHLDLMFRDQESRVEVPLAIVDGRAQDAITVKLVQAPLSGIYLGEMFEDLARISRLYSVRLIDFVNKTLDGTAAPVLPIIRVAEGDMADQQKIKLDGMAVFRDGKMVGRLSPEETLGYIWSYGDVRGGTISVFDGNNRALLSISKLTCKRIIRLRPDGGVQVTLKIYADTHLREILGFEQFSPAEITDYVQALAQEEITNRIFDALYAAQSCNADIFGFCTMLYKKYPGQWQEMKGRWDELFADIALDVQPKVNIHATGQILGSLVMEESKNEDR